MTEFIRDDASESHANPLQGPIEHSRCVDPTRAFQEENLIDEILAKHRNMFDSLSVMDEPKHTRIVRAGAWVMRRLEIRI